MIERDSRRGQILAENVVFIILNLIFLTILILFVFSKMGSEAQLEEKYSKQIALLIDSARPGTMIHLNMEDALEKAKQNGIPYEDVVSISNNLVSVKLRDKTSQSYSFFNDVKVTHELDRQNKKEYYFFVDKK
jgi:5S rRNA maturation endonuclease (ribonuclease M5)